MPYSLNWLPKVLRDAGLRVAETNGWLDRGRGEIGPVRGVMCHHTGSGGKANMPTLGTLIAGRGGTHPLSGPLAQLGLARDGTYYVIAAGRANHAGAGEWHGIKTGNQSFIGIEAENAGTPDDEWPDWQMDAYRRGAAAILKFIGAGPEMCCGHKEYALPKGRKPDPLFDMNAFRANIGQILGGTAVLRPTVPAVDKAGLRTLQRGLQGDDVEKIQRAVGVPVDGRFGVLTEAAVRRFQSDAGLRPDGVVGPATWPIILTAVPSKESLVSAPSPTGVAGPDTKLPQGAKKLLDLIASVEAPKGYDTIYGNNQNKLPKPLTTMTFSEVIAAGPVWTARFGSSACGRYQFMTDTLKGLRAAENLGGGEIFSSNLQDSLGYALLDRRGYERFITGKMSRSDFAKGLAQEWASFPVVEACVGAHGPIVRGDSYYKGDGKNAALLSPEQVENTLDVINPIPPAP